MANRNWIFVALIMLSIGQAGCCSNQTSYDIDSKWSPLKTIKQSDNAPDGVYYTEGAVMYTKDVCAFLSANQVDQDGLLKHEQLHSQRQFATVGGPQAYIVEYNKNIDFRWQEESLAYELQFTYIIQHGRTVDVDKMARFLSESYNGNDQFHKMIGYAEATVWINKVITDAKAK